jgi:hypothetical protein
MSRHFVDYNQDPQAFSVSLKLPKAILSRTRQQATGNRQQATGNRQQATGNYTHLIKTVSSNQ